jgi:predicted nucleic acid-binding protein
MKTKKFVLDTSYAISWLMPDEESPKLIYDRLIAPELLVFEVINALKTCVRSKRITPDIAQQLLREFESWDISYFKIENKSVLKLAVELELSGYDASYLWLAKEQKAELLTWDKKLKKLTSA